MGKQGGSKHVLYPVCYKAAREACATLSEQKRFHMDRFIMIRGTRGMAITVGM